MKITPRQKTSGMAVIVALVAVTVLTILAAAFAYSMKVETHLAANSNNDEEMLWLGRAGVQTAAWVIALDSNQPYDALNQIWAGGPGAGSETNSALMGFNMDEVPIGAPNTVGTVSIKIRDLERYVNINVASPQLIQQVLTAQGVDPDRISVVSDSVLDWIDPDDDTRPAGAESDYYQGLEHPYYAKNAPLDDVSELLLIKGVTPKMYWNTNSEPGARQNKLGFGHTLTEEADYQFALKDVLTPFGTGKININTADEASLMLIPGMTTDAAESIIKYRAGPDGQAGTEDDTPFQNPGMLNAAGIDPRAAQQISQFVTTKSSTFEVEVTAHIGELSRKFKAVIWRNGPQPQVVEFYWE
jgi:general secretion pathway protein K